MSRRRSTAEPSSRGPAPRRCSPARPRSARAPSPPTSATTTPGSGSRSRRRPARPGPGEVDGVHYHFVDDHEFDRHGRGGRAARVRPSCTAQPRTAPRAGPSSRRSRRPRRPARDRPAGRPSGAGDVARGAVRLPRAARAGTSWCAVWSVAAPRARPSGERRLATARAELAAEASSTWSSSTTTFVARAKNSYH